MLRYLADWLTQHYSVFNVFSYLTLRAIRSALRQHAPERFLVPHAYIRSTRWPRGKRET